uniref:Putative methyltransferase n=1 Tax=mine drainage metagenome TaxID=410659 RepID=E6PHL4_9ZZZZ
MMSPMRLRLIAVDKLRSAPIAALCDEFATRLQPMMPCEIREVRAADGRAPVSAMAEEAERILRLLPANEPLWLLERSGESLSSPQLSAKLAALDSTGISRLNLVVAGTYGAAPALLDRATFRWSLSPLTFLHEWARALVLEQLYRAAKIARNEPYHH